MSRESELREWMEMGVYVVAALVPFAVPFILLAATKNAPLSAASALIEGGAVIVWMWGKGDKKP